jgi:hypothetical protein
MRAIISVSGKIKCTPMKCFKVISVFVMITLTGPAYTQAYIYPERDGEKVEYIPGGFIGTGTGINNFNGILGLTAEALILRNITLAGAAGIGAWGYKFSIAGRYYLNYPKGVLFGLGYSSCTGLKNMEIELDTDVPGGNERVIVDLNRASTLNLTSGIQWRFGKRFRMGLEYGYAIPLQTLAWELVTENVVLSDASEQALDITTPGGIIIGFGISFGIQ